MRRPLMRRYSVERGAQPPETRLQFVPVERSCSQLNPQFGNLCLGLFNLYFGSPHPCFECPDPSFLCSSHDEPPCQGDRSCAG
jgi:hypothetical protein